MSRFNKPVRPFPNRADPLWRGCIYSVATGWDRGFSVTGSFSTEESTNRQKGVFSGAVLGTPYNVCDFGRDLGPGSGDDIVRYDDTGNRYDINTAGNGQITVAIVVRPSVDNVGADSGAIAKRQTFDIASPGWDIQMRNVLTDPWVFQISDGATEQRATGPDATMIRTDIIVGTWSDIVDLIEIFTNGVRNDSIATTITLPNNDEPISLFGYDDAASANILNCRLGMAAVWNRVLSSSEIARLNTDPYIMWKPVHKEFMFGPGTFGAFQTYLLSF